MGFEGRKLLKLTFEAEELAGLEVEVRRPTVDQVLAASDRGDELGGDEKGGLRAQAELFCELLVSWNLENDGVPVPHTAGDLLAQDQVVTLEIINAWQDSALRLSGPLVKRSTAGEPSVAASIPMETLSESRAS